MSLLSLGIDLSGFQAILWLILGTLALCGTSELNRLSRLGERFSPLRQAVSPIVILFRQ
jgi:hypothetical protein